MMMMTMMIVLLLCCVYSQLSHSAYLLGCFSWLILSSFFPALVSLLFISLCQPKKNRISTLVEIFSVGLSNSIPKAPLNLKIKWKQQATILGCVIFNCSHPCSMSFQLRLSITGSFPTFRLFPTAE